MSQIEGHTLVVPRREQSFRPALNSFGSPLVRRLGPSHHARFLAPATFFHPRLSSPSAERSP